MLCDTGPLVSLIFDNDKHHQRCLSALSLIRKPLLTTWACFTEAMHLLGKKSGARGQNELWRFVEIGVITLYNQGQNEQKRMQALMNQYNQPKLNRLMDLADASLIAAAETLGLTLIFMIDSDFQFYRIYGAVHFEIIPNPYE